MEIIHAVCPDCSTPFEYPSNKVGPKPTYCKPCRSKDRRKYRDRNINESDRLRWHLKYRFGITSEQYDEMFAAQFGRCALCGRTQDDRRLSVDHDHGCCPGERSCGTCIRGLLCHSCNVALGLLRDDPAVLRAAADYIEASRKG